VKKMIYPLLAAVLLAPLPQAMPQAEAASQTVVVSAERRDNKLDEVMKAVRCDAVRKAMAEGVAPWSDSSRLGRRILRDYDRYILHCTTLQSKRTAGRSLVKAQIEVDRDAMDEYAERFIAQQKDMSVAFLIRNFGSTDGLLAESVVNSACSRIFGDHDFVPAAGANPPEARATDYTPQGMSSFERYTDYMLDKLYYTWLNYQFALVGEIEISRNTPGQVTALVHVRAVDADESRVIEDIRQEYTGTAEPEVLRLAAEDFATRLLREIQQDIKAREAAESAQAGKKSK